MYKQKGKESSCFLRVLTILLFASGQKEVSAKHSPQRVIACEKADITL